MIHHRSYIVNEDFNARCRNWLAGYANSNAGKELDALTSRAGYTKLIEKLIHFFRDGSSCIDLVFCNRPEIVSEWEIDQSLFIICLRNLIFVKISANMSLPPSYIREVWDYKNANVERIQKSIYIIKFLKKFLKTYQLMRKLVFSTTLHYILQLNSKQNGQM